MGVLVSHATWFSHDRHENPQVAKTKILTSVAVSRLYGSRQLGKEKEEREEERERDRGKKEEGNYQRAVLRAPFESTSTGRQKCVRQRGKCDRRENGRQRKIVREL